MSEAILTQEQEKAVVCPQGDVVAASVPELRSLLKDTISGGARDIVLDLCHVAMVDSSGLGLLIGTYNSLHKVGGRLAIVHASKDLLQLFQTMRMHQRFAISGNE